MKTAIEGWKSCDKTFKKAIRNYQEGNFLTYFVNEERCIADQIDENLTVYKSVESGKIIGVRLSGQDHSKRHD